MPPRKPATEPETDPSETWVTMTHPDLASDQAPATVTLAAFQELWEGKGWKRGDLSEAPAGAITGE